MMKFSSSQADVLVSAQDATPEAALRRVTHLCIAAHPDDIEIMAQSGISDCLDNPGKAFGGVVVTDGAGSPRTGAFAGYSDAQMVAVRREEQRTAARLGRYAIQVQLGHPSSDVKRPGHGGVVADLATLLSVCTPEVLFLHNPADKHDTHVAVLLRCLEAIRILAPEHRPKRVLGCEGWRNLDWLPESEKVALDSGRHPEIAKALVAAFESQIAGGKRYDLAAAGRRSSNATFDTPHAADRYAGVTWAVDLTPVTRPGGPALEAFTEALVSRFGADVAQRLKALT
jgi:LmbE family N-acetylglucosaminyl deacetylase